MLTALLSLTVLAADPFAGCEVEGPSPGIERRLFCQHVWVSVTVDKPKDAGQAAMLEVIDSRSSASSRATDSVKEITAGADPLPGRTYVAQGTTVYLVLLPAGADRVRMAHCEETKPELCSKLFAELKKALPAPTKAAVLGPLQFGASKLTVPSNCRNSAPARIECTGTALTWSHFGAEDEGVFEVSVEALEAGLGRIGVVSRRKLACTVAGAATSCALLTITKPDGTELYTIFGVGLSGSMQVAAQCNTTKAPTSSLGAPCDQAISFANAK